MKARSIVLAGVLCCGVAVYAAMEPGSPIPPAPREAATIIDLDGVIACGPLAAMELRLAERWDERLAAVGITDGGRALELYVSPVGGFTVVIVDGSGHACIVLAGDRWTDVRSPVTPNEKGG